MLEQLRGECEYSIEFYSEEARLWEHVLEVRMGGNHEPQVDLTLLMS
jgi:hypothetical protein